MSGQVSGVQPAAGPLHSAGLVEHDVAPDELLPQPVAVDGCRDTMLALQALLLRMRDQSTTAGKARIESNERLAQQAIKDSLEALHEKWEAEREDGGFFSGLGTAFEAVTVDLAKLETITDPVGSFEEAMDKVGDATVNNRAFMDDLASGALEVAKWAAVAGSVALAIVSCGAAAPIAALAIVGAVASCAAAADSTFGVLEKLGVDKDTAMWIDVGLSVGGALCSGGAGIALALQSGAATTTTAVRMGAIVADGAAGASTVVGAGARMRVASFDEDAKLAQADAREAQAAQQRIERRIQALLQMIKETIESHGRGLKRVGEAMRDFNAARVAVVRA